MGVLAQATTRRALPQCTNLWTAERVPLMRSARFLGVTGTRETAIEIARTFAAAARLEAGLTTRNLLALGGVADGFVEFGIDEALEPVALGEAFHQTRKLRGAESPARDEEASLLATRMRLRVTRERLASDRSPRHTGTMVPQVTAPRAIGP